MRNSYLRFFLISVCMFCVVSIAFGASPPPVSSSRTKALNAHVTQAANLIAPVTISIPAQGTKWRVGTEKTIKWTADSSLMGPQVKILLMQAQQVQNVNGQQGFRVVKDSISSGWTGFNWKIPENIPSGGYRIVIRSLTNGTSGSSQIFKIIPQPVFQITQPANNSTWEIGKTYTVRWNYSGEALGPLSLILFGSGGKRVDGIPVNGQNGDRSCLFTVPASASPGPFGLILAEVNEEAKLENDLIGYRGTSIGIQVVKEIVK